MEPNYLRLILALGCVTLGKFLNLSAFWISHL